MCKCVNVKMGTYSNQTVMITPWFPYKQVGIDNCLLEEILMLWETGVRTLESCCGHNITNGYIAVDAASIDKMKSLGYTQREGREEIFYPKTA